MKITKTIKSYISSVWTGLKNGILSMMFANVLNKVVGMLSNMVLARVMTTSNYGIWCYVLNVYSYLTLASGLGLVSGALQFGSENRDNDNEFKYYRYCLKVGAIIDTVLVIGFVIATYIFRFAFEESNEFIRFYVPVLILEYFMRIMLIILRCENRVTEFTSISNVNTVVLALGTCVGAFFGIRGIIVGKYIAFAATTIMIVLRTRPEIKKTFAAGLLIKEQTSELWHYSLFVGISSALNQLMYYIDVSMIARLVNDAVAVANYKVATFVPNALILIPNSIITVMLPDIIAHNKDLKWLKSKLRITFVSLALINTVVCGLLFVFSPFVIRILYGHEYSDAVPIMRVLICDYFISGTFRTVSVNTIAGLKHVNYNLLISVCSALCDVIFNYLLINIYGVIGAAYATLGVVIVAAGMSFIYLIIKLNQRHMDGELS